MMGGRRGRFGLRRAMGPALGALLAASAARGEGEARVLRADPAIQEGRLVCGILLGDLFTPPVESTLRSGLPVIVDLVCEVEAADLSLGQFVRSELAYDVWEDRYSLLRGGESRVFASFEEVHEACRRYSPLSLASLAALGAAGSFHLRLRVAVNPLSGEERERMSRWLAETVTDPADPSARELRLDLGSLIRGFLRGGDSSQGWGPESLFGPFRLSALPVLPADPQPDAGTEGPGPAPEDSGSGSGGGP